MMDFTIHDQKINLNATLSKGLLLAEGVVSDKYTLLRFEAGNSCILKGKTATILTMGDWVHTSKGSLNVEDFLKENAYAEICFRIEKDNLGPYSCKNVSSNYRQWVGKQLELAQVRRWTGVKEHQPSLSEDPALNSLAGNVELLKFAFSSYEQMFRWFCLEEIQMMRKEGFKVVVHQKGRDYYNSFQSHFQAVLVSNEKDYLFLQQIQQNCVIPYY